MVLSLKWVETEIPSISFPSFLLPFLLLFCPFACFNLIGKPVARCQADKCTETLLTFNLFMDRCKYCCQWYQSLVQQSPRKLLIHFLILCSLQSVTENCDPEYSFLTKTIELSRAQLQKIAFIFKQCYTHADTLLMILLPWRKYIAPARILSFGALSHTSDDKIPTERLLFNLTGHRLYSGQFSLLSSFRLDKKENSF